MIKTLIKHQLIDYAIAVFFDNLIDGFSAPEIKKMRKLNMLTPGLFSYDMVGVVPMSEPIGINFALRYLYDKDSSETFSI